MTIRCIGCARAIRVPDDKAQNPRLKVKCTCGTVFALADAMSAAETAASAERAVVAPRSLGPQVETHVSDIPAMETSSPLEDLVDTPPAAAEPVPARRTRPPGGWRRCVNHHAAQSQSVCTRCQIGYCPDCEQKVQNAVLCTVCEGLCVPAQQYEGEQEHKRQRQRSMMEELEVIARYPLQDPMAFAMLALFTGFFGFFARFAAFYGAIAIVLSQGVLVWYCFHALNKVAGGNLKDVMPQFDDISDVVRPLRLGLAALAISAGPLFALYLWSSIGVARSFLVDGPAPAAQEQVVHAASAEAAAVEDAEAEQAGTALDGGWLLLATLLLIPAIIWKIVYTPVALTVAALSRSILSTLNPTIGFDTIKRMGPTYWQAMLIYTVLAFGQWVLGFLLSWIPFVGGVVASFVDAYVYLAIGCTLGLAVFKKAPELGWD
jgi:hypothetical protein